MGGPHDDSTSDIGVYFSAREPSARLRQTVDAPGFVDRLEAILSAERPVSASLRALLRLGTEHLEVENGHLAEIDPAAGTHTIVAMSGSHPALSQDETRDLSVTYCRRVLARNAAMGLRRAPEQGWRDDPAYREFGFSTYVGAKVVTEDRLYGTLCFVDRAARDRAVDATDAAVLGLLVEGAERILDRDRRRDDSPSYSTLRAAFRGAPAMIFFHGVDGYVHSPNPRCLDETGYGEEELSTLHVSDLVNWGPENAETDWNGLQPGQNQEWQGTIRRKNGTTIPAQVHVGCVEVNGRRQFVVTAQDRAHRTDGEADVHRRDRLHYETLRNITDTVLVAREDGTLTYVCPNVNHIFGYQREEAARLGTVSALLGDDPAAGYDLDRNGELTNVEQSITDAEGDRHDLLVNVRSVSIGAGTRMYTCRDVTERKAAERKLRATKRLLQKTFESLTDAVFIVDPSGRRILSCNAAAEAVFGYDRDELIGKSTKVLHVDDQAYQEFGNVSESVLEAEGYFEGEYELRRKDGTIIHTEHRITPLVGEKWPKGVVSVIRDLSDKKRARRQLREQEARLRGLANSIPGVVVQFFARDDGTYGNYFVSERAERVLGISADPDTFFERFLERVPPLERDALVESIDEAVEEGKAWRQEMPFVKPSGEEIWLLGTTTPRRREGELVFNGVVLDITEQKHAERALREERDRFATLFHNLPTPVVHGRPDDDGRLRVEAVNDAFESVFGYAEDAIQGADLQRLLVPESERSNAEAIRRRLLKGRPVDREVRRKTVDGLRDFRVQVAVGGGDGGPTDGYAIYTDVTERKERERMLARRKALLEAQAESTIDGLLVTDRDGRVEFVNDRFRDLWQLSPSDLDPGRTTFSGPGGLLETISPLLPAPAEFVESVSRLVDDAHREHRDVVQLTDGRWIDCFTAPIGRDWDRRFGRLWVFRDVTDERRLQERLLEVQEEERRRIDQEIHDNLGGLLTSMQLTVDVARRAVPDDAKPVDALEQMEALVSEVSSVTRTISRKLFPSAIDEYGLAGTLPSLTEEIATDYDLDVTLDTSLQTQDRFSMLLERTAYWIVQEALLNVGRHAHVDEARVRVAHRDRQLSIEVSDLGVGFEPDSESSHGGVGLKSLRRRVEQMNGDMTVEAAPDEGTRIVATLPITRPVPRDGES